MQDLCRTSGKQLVHTLKDAAQNIGAVYYLHKIAETKNLSAGDFEPFQFELLARTIERARKRVPFWNEFFTKRGLTGADFKSTADLAKLPILEKDTIRQRNAEFFSDDWPKLYHTTSGTTGTPLTIARTLRDLFHAKAVNNRFRIACGLQPFDRVVSLCGFFPPSEGPTHPLAWKTPISYEMFMSVYDFSRECADRYASLLEWYRPVGITGYTSAVYVLAELLEEAGRKPPDSIRCILPTSEMLYPYFRESIERVFGARVYDQYGSHEQQCFTHECRAGRVHINPDVGIIEILDGANQPVAEGEVGDVIVSGLGREGMPLFRYRIGDTATAGRAGISCECGLEWPTLGPITGRSEDVLITKDGRRLPLLHHPLKVAQGVLEGQIVQEDYENITIRLVCKPGVTKVNEEAIAAELNRRSGGAFSVHFEYMDAIPRKKSGKFKAVVSKVAASAPKDAAMPIATELPTVKEKERAR